MSYTKQHLDENKKKVNLDEVVSDEWDLSKKKKINDNHDQSEWVPVAGNERGILKDIKGKINLNEDM